MEVHLVSRADYSRDGFDNRIPRQFFVVSNRRSDSELLRRDVLAIVCAIMGCDAWNSAP
jgi:hypothetical protein